MRKRKLQLLSMAGFLVGLYAFFLSQRVPAKILYQIPTVSIPTVTSSPTGPTATVRRDIDQDSVNVRAGPNAKYDIIGVLIVGQVVPALGRTPGGDWIQIYYPGVPDNVGWVYAPLLSVNGNLPIVEPPPTPTPRTTPTIDPTLQAQLIVEIPPTRLPTFTAPPPLDVPSFETDETVNQPVTLPAGLIIAGMGFLGFFGLLISILRGR